MQLTVCLRRSLKFCQQLQLQQDMIIRQQVFGAEGAATSGCVPNGLPCAAFKDRTVVRKVCPGTPEVPDSWLSLQHTFGILCLLFISYFSKEVYVHRTQL
jgi:hypothetical protein